MVYIFVVDDEHDLVSLSKEFYRIISQVDLNVNPIHKTIL
jgi:hypothetical protein